jgi:hypothetical protein
LLLHLAPIGLTVIFFLFHFQILLIMALMSLI